jgi:hypothetical protein
MTIDDKLRREPCRDAVEGFRRDRGIEEPTERID